MGWLIAALMKQRRWSLRRAIAFAAGDRQNCERSARPLLSNRTRCQRSLRLFPFVPVLACTLVRCPIDRKQDEALEELA